jgi:hypothetical protein
LKGLTVATKLHNQMSGADLHPNAIDGATGTELTPASQTTYDGRYVRTIGGTVTPTANGTATVTVNRQDGTTAVLVVDTTNNRVQVGNGTSGTLKVGDANISKSGGSNWSMGGTNFSGAIGLALRTVTTNYTMSTGADCMVLADATSGVVTVTLPSAGGANSSAIYMVKRTSSAANNVTVATTSSQTIDGATTKTLGSQYATIMVQSNGSNWFIISTVGTVS